MSKAEILAEIPRLSTQDRMDILEQLWRIEETSQPTPREKTLLQEAQAEYDAHPNEGNPWSEVQSRLRKRA
jgi:putative addiction module component (TIGR02574 family)